MSANQRNLILVVDDNAANAFALTMMLQKLGFEADGVSSGLEAVNSSCQKEYDVILMDHLMPDMDGIETIRQIRQLSSDREKPVIIGVSATLDGGVAEDFCAAGANSVLEKPVTLDRLEEKLALYGFEGTVGEEEDAAENSEIESLLSAVEGLDYQKGTDMLAGSVDNYMKVLGVSVRNIEENRTALEALSDNGQAEPLALHFHSLKGIFLNIGGDGLADESRDMELAAKQGDMEFVQGRLDGYLERLAAFHGSLQEACRKYQQRKQEQHSGREISVPEFVQKLEALMEHIRDFEYIEITEGLEELEAVSRSDWKGRLEDISSAVEAFDYDKALMLAEELRNAVC